MRQPELFPFAVIARLLWLGAPAGTLVWQWILKTVQGAVIEWAAQPEPVLGLAFTPIFFAGVVFAVSFTRATEPDRAFGANIAGAMFGGLAEYSSMLLGFQYLLFVAAALYIISIVGYQKAVIGMPASHIGHDPAA